MHYFFVCWLTGMLMAYKLLSVYFPVIIASYSVHKIYSATIVRQEITQLSTPTNWDKLNARLLVAEYIPLVPVLWELLHMNFNLRLWFWLNLLFNFSDAKPRGWDKLFQSNLNRIFGNLESYFLQVISKNRVNPQLIASEEGKKCIATCRRTVINNMR